jgi:hypothetical protein
LYHYQNEGSTDLHVNQDLKNALKKRGFKWKTVINDTKTHERYEVMECPNIKYKE